MAANIGIDPVDLVHSRVLSDPGPSDRAAPESSAEDPSDEVTHQTPVAVVAHSIGVAKVGHFEVEKMAGC